MRDVEIEEATSADSGLDAWYIYPARQGSEGVGQEQAREVSG